MSNALLNRLDRLEQRMLPTTEESMLLWVCFGGPDEDGAEPTASSAKCNGQTFTQRPDESFGDFQERIEAETRPGVPTLNLRVVVLEPAEVSA